MFSYMILLYSLQVKTNVCYARYLVCQNTLSYNVEKSIEVIHYNNTVRKDVPTSHQRVQSSKLVLNRKQNAFQTHLT